MNTVGQKAGMGRDAAGNRLGRAQKIHRIQSAEGRRPALNRYNGEHEVSSSARAQDQRTYE